MSVSVEERALIVCECGLSEHQFLLALYEWGDEVEVFMEPHLATYQNFFERVKTAIRYVFGYRCKYGEWDCVELGEKQLQQMLDFIYKASACIKAKRQQMQWAVISEDEE